MAKLFPMLLVAGLAIAPAQAAAQTVFETSDLSEMPSLKSADQTQRAIARSYPQNQQDAGIGGTVQIRFVVGSDGKVAESTVEVLATSSKLLGEAAAKAVSAIEFVPGKKDGSAVASYVVMPIRYAVQ
jgi:protein TonB